MSEEDNTIDRARLVAIEAALSCWDDWVAEIRSGDLSDLPRMQFEAILDAYVDDVLLSSGYAKRGDVWNEALEAAARFVETCDDNIGNTGILHPISRRQAAAIRALKEPRE